MSTGTLALVNFALGAFNLFLGIYADQPLCLILGALGIAGGFVATAEAANDE